jgi:hypothetical protein
LIDMSMLPGNQPLSNLRSLVDSKIADMESRRGSSSESPSWPSGAKLFRVLLVVVVLIVLTGWVLTALNR